MRTARILDIVSKPQVFVALITLCSSDSTQQELLAAVERADVGRSDQGTLSRDLTRLVDLGLLEKRGKRGSYRLLHPKNTVNLLAAALALSESAAGTEAEVEGRVRQLLRRRQIRAVKISG